MTHSNNNGAMSVDEMKKAIETIAGGGGYGHVKAAAAALGVSRKTISKALSGQIPQSFSDKVELELRRIADRDDGQAVRLDGHAGEWSVGHVETRQNGGSVVDEAVVTHMVAPYFFMHIAMIRGKRADGQQDIEEKIRWCDGSDAGSRPDLIEKARSMGVEAIYDRSLAVAERKARDHKELILRRAGYGTDELAALAYTDLAAEARIARHKLPGGIRASLMDHEKDLQSRRAEMVEAASSEVGRVMTLLSEILKEIGVDIEGNGSDEFGHLSSEIVKLVQEIGGQREDLGFIKAAHMMTLVALKDAGASASAQHSAAVAYDNLPQAHNTSVRGRRMTLSDKRNAEQEAALEKAAWQRAQDEHGAKIDAMFDDDAGDSAD